MKKALFLVLVVVMIFPTFTGCKNAKRINVELSIDEIISKEELATLRCTYHNLINQNEIKKKFIFFKEEYSYWIEYDGNYTVGVDLKKMSIETEKVYVSEDDANKNVKVIISLPHSHLITAEVDEESFAKYQMVASKDSIINSEAAFKLETFGELVAEAQDQMETELNESRTNFDTADKYVQELIEKAIMTAGESIGVNYTIEWKWLEETTEGE